MAYPSLISVVAAVIVREEKYLICQRPLDKRHGGLWEFPGGKLLPGESMFDGARRELHEELDIEVQSLDDSMFTVQDPGSDFMIMFCPVEAVGEPTADQRRIFEVCESAMQSGEQTFKAGAAAADVYAAASSMLEGAGYPALGHHAGHGIGLGHPEAPILVPESTDTLLAGDVVTLEPGLYVEGVGGVRIEHNYLITETGSRRLSNHRLSLV